MRATRFFPSTVVCFSIAFYSALVWSAEQLNYKDTVHIKVTMMMMTMIMPEL